MLLGRCPLCSPGIPFGERGVGGEDQGASGLLLGKALSCRSMPRSGGLGSGILQPWPRDAQPGHQSCVRERDGGKKIIFLAETWIFYVPCFIFWRPSRYLCHPCWCLQKALWSLAVPWLLPVALALWLRCRQRLLLCRERAPQHPHTPSPSPSSPLGGRCLGMG